MYVLFVYVVQKYCTSGFVPLILAVLAAVELAEVRRIRALNQGAVCLDMGMTNMYIYIYAASYIVYSCVELYTIGMNRALSMLHQVTSIHACICIYMHDIDKH